ncbi:MAG: histidine--tRNA ligase [Chloroflexi bacterium]|nr:histidine--tRNA ligase [Chloroflexota bacterium]
MFRAPRGTTDILPADQKRWRHVTEAARQVAESFGYGRIDTPLFEDSKLFVRGIGEVTDIVEKETYTFEDRGNDLLTLRPEGTASVCRAYIEHGMHNQPQPVRLYYICPIFRYERPQSGRYRQHHQFGIEAIGDASAAIDAEVIELGWRLLEKLGLHDLALRINSIGDKECRPAYVRLLQDYYDGHVNTICEDCQRRLQKNPLRLLDCKNEQCQPVIAKAPHGVDHLCEPCRTHWDELQTFLNAVGLPFEIDNRLVRGFDYYTRTVFEIVPPVEGSQSTIVGGGRYDGLIEELDGNPTPGIGFGMGIERILVNLDRQGVEAPSEGDVKVAVLHLGAEAMNEAVRLGSELRQGGVAAVVVAGERSLKSQMRYASGVGATHVIIIGEDELRSGEFQLRDLAASQQSSVRRDDLVSTLLSAH